MELPDPVVVAKLHDDLVAWLKREHPRAELLVILGALSYEIGRIGGFLTEGKSDAEVARVLDGVRDAMHEHVQAFRRGLRI